MSQIADEVTAFVSKEILHGSVTEPVGADVDLLREGILDSLGLQMLVAFLESHYSISIGDDELVPANFATVTSISEMVARLRS